MSKVVWHLSKRTRPYLAALPPLPRPAAGVAGSAVCQRFPIMLSQRSRGSATNISGSREWPRAFSRLLPIGTPADARGPFVL